MSTHISDNVNFWVDPYVNNRNIHDYRLPSIESLVRDGGAHSSALEVCAVVKIFESISNIYGFRGDGLKILCTYNNQVRLIR